MRDIQSELSKPEILNHIVTELLKIQGNYIRLNSTLNILLKEQKQVETAINNLVSAIERGIISNATNKRLHDLEERQTELERKILIERSKTVVRLSENDIREYYEQALELEPQMLINYLVKQIILFDDKIKIYYNSPKKISPDDDRQGFSFYSRTDNMFMFLYSNTQPKIQKVLIEMNL